MLVNTYYMPVILHTSSHLIITVILFPILKMCKLKPSLSTTAYFLSLVKGILWDLWPWAWESMIGAQHGGEVGHGRTGRILVLVMSAHCLRLCDILPRVSLAGIRNSIWTEKRKQFEFYKKKLELGVWIYFLESQLLLLDICELLPWFSHL